MHGVQVIGMEHIVGLVFLHLGLDFCLGDFADLIDQLTHRPGIHLPAQLDLRFNFVAFGDGHFAHVVAEAHHRQALADPVTGRGAHPGAQLFQHSLILPVTGDHLAVQAQPGPNEAMLSVAVRRLV